MLSCLLQRHLDNPAVELYRVFIKNCVSFQFTATNPLHVGEALISARDLSVQSLLLLVISCTTNSSPVRARERSQRVMREGRVDGPSEGRGPTVGCLLQLFSLP